MQSFLFKIFFLKSSQINVSLNYSFTCYVISSCVRRCNDVLSHVCTQSHKYILLLFFEKIEFLVIINRE